ncbi:sensor histidine kinase [Pantoea sp. AS-PWVM4]|uniref:ATP-binding protein n=1 Tax=Pantoea sp. AS-PWVM4 TaxID=1332069 RepID=UPI0003AC983C|nr:ATP-binding protein [Pantoea sp. AS-PWVM4]ERK16313.1 sensor histidine kinase [Pantoea sp. AS-PWVM4]
MKKFFSTTLGHILIIISCSTVITFMVLCTLLFIPKGPPGPPWPWQTTYRISSIVNILREVEPAQQNAILQAAQRADGMKMRWVTQQPVSCTTQTFNTWDLARSLASELKGGNHIDVFSCNSQNPRQDIQVIINMGNGYLEVMVDNIGREPTRFTFPTFCAILFLLTGIAVMSIWAIGRIISPLRELSIKADAFSRDMTVIPVKEEGPLEIRRVAHTFNLMQERISSYMQSRSHMLAAISHDLRTPLTRMRLGIDTWPPEIAKEKLIKDIDLMTKLIGAALSFIRTGSDGEKPERLDLDALLTTLCDEYEDGGTCIQYIGTSTLELFCKPEAIQRAIVNLIENAAAHADQIAIYTRQAGDQIIIEIMDNGPGIPPDMLEKVKEPFFHLNSARNERKGNAGLGLSIVNEIVQLHGGVFELMNRNPHGLNARVTLPKSLHARTEYGHASS